MENLTRDLGFGLRQLIKHPGFTLVSVLALGLGIGTVTTQISVVNGLFLKGLPFPEPGRIVSLERHNVELANQDGAVPILEFIEWRRQQEAFEDLSGYYTGTANLTLENKVERYSGCFISGNAFALLRAEAFMGRALQPEDDLPESPDTVVLSHNVWHNDFGKDPDIIGKTAILNGRTVRIVGVMPEGFAFPLSDDLWVPLFKQQDPSRMEWGSEQMGVNVMGRLKPGVSMEAARASMNILARNLENQFLDTQRGYREIKVQRFIDQYLGRETVSMTAVMLLITLLRERGKPAAGPFHEAAKGGRHPLGPRCITQPDRVAVPDREHLAGCARGARGNRLRPLDSERLEQPYG